MPRDSNGNYSLPGGTLVNIGDTVLPSQHNPAMNDIGNALTNSLSRNGAGGMLGPLPMNGNRIVGTAEGVAPNDVATVSQVSALGIPVGVWMHYGGDVAPDGWLLCSGQAVSRTTYSELFAVIGTKFGAGDGSTTFNVPDKRGRVDVGKDDMTGAAANRVTTAGSGIDGKTVGATGGAQSVALTQAQLPAHNHTGTTASAGAHVHDALVGNGFNGPNTYLDLGGETTIGNWPGFISSAGAHTHSFTTANTGTGEAHNNMQPSLVSTAIIRARSV